MVKQVTGLLELFNIRNLEVAEVPEIKRSKKRHNKHLNGDEKMESGRPRSIRKLVCGESHLMGKQYRCTPFNDSDNHEARVIPSSMIPGTGCSTLGHESGMSFFGQGSQPSVYTEEPENLKPSMEEHGGVIPLSLPGSLSYYNDLNLYREEQDKLKHSQDLRTNHGDFIRSSFTANEPSLYGQEADILKHSSQNHRTDLRDILSLSSVANEPSSYRQEPQNLEHSSQYLRTGLQDLGPVSFSAKEPSFYRQEPEHLKHLFQDQRTNLGECRPLSFTANEPTLYREETGISKHSSQDHRNNLGESLALLFNANETSLCRQEQENFRHCSQDLQDFKPVSFPDNVSDCNVNDSGHFVAKKRVGVFARLGKVSKSDRQDTSVFTRLQWGNSKYKMRNAKSTFQAKKDKSQGKISVEPSSDTLQDNGHWNALTRDRVVSTCEYEYHFKKDTQMGKMLKERDPTEETETADDHLKTLAREPVVSVQNREYEDNLKKSTHMKKRDPTEERDSVDGSSRKLEHRPRRKLIRPLFFKPSEVKTSCPNSSVNEEMPSQESSNNGKCAETSKTIRADGEEVPPVMSPSQCKGDDSTGRDSKLEDIAGDRFNSGAGTVTKPLATYRRRPKK